MDQVVCRALEDMGARREGRKMAFSCFDKEAIVREMQELRKVMFSRRESGEAFHPLSSHELAVLENCVEGYVADKRFVVCGDNLFEPYGVIRHNLLTGRNDVSPDEFREASDAITRAVFKTATEPFKDFLGTAVVLFVWRAGLAFAGVAQDSCCRQLFHLGVSRNEHTLETEKPYYENVPWIVRVGGRDVGGTLNSVICDPMLATGGTDIFAIRRLQEFGFREKDIVIASVISAPEGVDRILSMFPGVTIVTGAHDERLNERGYIEPGLGDYGDLYCKGLGRNYGASLLEREVFHEDDLAAFNQRMSL